jgi:ankyrin repeat protein
MFNKRSSFFVFVSMFSSLCTYSSENQTSLIELYADQKKNPIGNVLFVSNPTLGKDDPSMLACLHAIILDKHLNNRLCINDQRWDTTGNTPLHVAVLRRHDISTIRLLVSLGACTKRVNMDGLTPVECAFKMCEVDSSNSSTDNKTTNNQKLGVSIIGLDTAQFLLESDLQRNRKDTVTSSIRYCNSSNLFHCLMSNKVVFFIDNKRLKHLLHCIAECGDWIGARDLSGKTPQEYARTNRCDDEIIRYLADIENSQHRSSVVQHSMCDANFGIMLHKTTIAINNL